MKTPQESEPFQTVIRIRNFVISGVTSPNNICAQKCAERMTRAMLYGYPRWRTTCPWSNYLLGHDILMHIKKINEYYIWRKGWLIKVKEGYIVIRNLIKPKATSHSLDGRFLSGEEYITQGNFFLPLPFPVSELFAFF